MDVKEAIRARCCTEVGSNVEDTVDDEVLRLLRVIPEWSLHNALRDEVWSIEEVVKGESDVHRP